GISYDPKVQRLMEEIQCPGWDLTALPSDPAVMAQQWIQVLNAKATLSPAQRQTLIEQALQHRQCFDA
ncbi:MAG TPA: polysaccharide pyruvyl transferase CsaB, partial [Stenomitos sp.]